MKLPEPKPYWVFLLWCRGVGDSIAARHATEDPELFQKGNDKMTNKNRGIVTGWEEYDDNPDDFASAFKYAVEQGYIKFDETNFVGWLNECDCKGCTCQKIVYDYLWGNPPEKQQ